jgi:hypothetical protein
VWRFRGADFQGEVATPIAIAGTGGATSQDLEQTLLRSTEFEVTVDRATTFSEDFAALFDSVAARSAPIGDVEDAVLATIAMDDASSDRNPTNTDCASCHLATPLRAWAVRERGVDLAAFASVMPTSDHWDLTNTTETVSSSSFRGFGYFGRDVAISQRTIDEAAQVADRLNETVLGTRVAPR